MQHTNNSRAFSLKLRTEVVFGGGRIEEIGSLTHPYSRNVLLVTDKNLAGTGAIQKAREALEALNITVTLYDNAKENPTESDAEECKEVATSAGVTGIVAIGGGSVIDTAKGANFLLTNGGKMRDYRGYGHNDDALLPLIAVPTTAGTGSEVQSYALISHDETHQKMACGTASCAPVIALLDPQLLLTCPPSVIATAGIDALTHAVESYFSKTANPFAQMYSVEAFRCLTESYRMAVMTAYQKVALSENEKAAISENELDWLEGLQLGACYAGIAIDHSMLGGAHASANPITAHFPISHGQAVGLMMPHVLRYNAKESRTVNYGLRDLFELVELVGYLFPSTIEIGIFETLWSEFMGVGKLKTRLSELGIAEDDLPGLSEEAATQWTAQHNPVPLDKAAFLEIYRAAL